MTNLYKIGVVGGSASGKTSCINALRVALGDIEREFGVTILIADEAASVWLKKSPTRDNKTVEFQIDVFSSQLHALNEAEEYAKLHPSESIYLFCDRTLLDAFVYQPKWANSMLDFQKIENQYDEIIYILPRAIASKDITNGNAQRCEATVDELLKNEKKTRAVYEQCHMDITYIKSCKSVEEKTGNFVNAAIDIIARHNAA
jgi:GTPase SAR1 family protein